MRARNTEAFIIALGLGLLGWMLKSGINNFKDKERIVSVKGLAEMEVKANKVTWPLAYKAIGNDPALLYTNLEKKNRTIVQFLKDNGITEQEISIAPPEVIDLQAERYGTRDFTYRYNATSVITVTSGDVEKVRKLMNEQAELLKQGIAITGGDYRYNVSYRIERHQAPHDRRGDQERPRRRRAVCQRLRQRPGQNTERLARTVLHLRPRRQYALY